MNIQDWFPLGLILQSKGLSRVFSKKKKKKSFIQHHSSKASILIYVSEVKWSEFTQSCPNLLDTMACSLSGSSIHGIFQARILEWVAISFSNICLWSEVWSEVARCVPLFVTPWTVANRAPPSMGLSRQEHWSGLPFPSPGQLPNPGIEPRSPTL